jgi:hypothetical protein
MSNEAFGNMMKGFFDDLLTEFPDNEVIKEASQKVVTRKTMERFLRYTGARLHLLSAKSDAFFSEKNKFMNEIGLCDLWKTELRKSTRDAIWAHVQNMHMLASSISMLPPDMLNVIESTANSMAKEAESDGGEMTQEKLMGMMTKMMTQLGGKFPSR